MSFKAVKHYRDDFITPLFVETNNTSEAEVAVEHRIEQSENTGWLDDGIDHVTDIRNHISPMTIVRGD